MYLLDLDFYAPSLYSYFTFEPKYWINDYLKNKVELDRVLIDSKTFLNQTLKGELIVGFSKGDKEDIYQLEGSLLTDKEQQVRQFRNFINMREELVVNKDADFVIMDTSPGIRYWSINSIVISDIVLLALKMGDLDLKGTVKMVKEIYGSLIEQGSVCKLLLNRVAGYCVPHSFDEPNVKLPEQGHSLFKERIEDELQGFGRESVMVDTLLEIPCYCDIQFMEKEYLTSMDFPEHPFTNKLHNLVIEIEKLM